MNIIRSEKPNAAVSIDEIERWLEMQHLQAMEGNPLAADEIAMFEMFEREGWSSERQLAYLQEQAKRRGGSKP